jgi:hypothetical protein
MNIWNQEKADLLIPEHMHGGLRRYIENGILPGSFLTAVLTNDLKNAIGFADHINLWNIPRYVSFLYNYAPSGCWGSPAKVQSWVEKLQETTQESAND